MENGTLIVTPLLINRNKNAHPNVLHSGAAIFSSLRISPLPPPDLSFSLDKRALRFSLEACAAFSVRPNPSSSSSSSCSVGSVVFDFWSLLCCSGAPFAACASRWICDVCRTRRCAGRAAVRCMSSRGRDVCCVFGARDRVKEEACLAAPAIRNEPNTLQRGPPAMQAARILVENSAPFPRQSQALAAIICDEFIYNSGLNQALMETPLSQSNRVFQLSSLM